MVSKCVADPTLPSGIYLIAVQIFLGTQKTVYILDKVQNNPAKINGHAAWASGEHP